LPAVFVHGNPETDAIWASLFDALSRDDIIALSPPGFGAPVPEGWTATRAEYISWLAAELAALDGPIDLVGHDWGGGHVLGYLVGRPDSVRSWCVDVMGLVHPDYRWHDAALVWQTPGDGEAHVEGWLATPVEDRALRYVSVGMTQEVAQSVSEAIDQPMGDAILRLYRDAAQPHMAELGAEVGALTARPGLVINAEHDHYVGTDAQTEQMAVQAGATVARLGGVGHWWMCQDPDQGAAALEAFWAGLG